MRGVQLAGLTAALAAAAGTSAVGLTATSAQPTAGPGLSPSQADAVTAARVERRELASRDLSRINMSMLASQKREADRLAKLREAKLAAAATLTQRRALALKTAKAAAAAKAAAEAKAEAKAKAEAAKKAAAAAAKKAVGGPSVAEGNVVLPVSGGYRLTARFGQAGSRWARNHTGLDFAAPTGTPVRAVLAGEVTQASFEGAYGRQVKVRHADGTVTSYSHLSAFEVSVGDSVGAGTVVGAVGSTGNVTGPHLHFEVLPGGDGPIDPAGWLRDHGVRP